MTHTVLIPARLHSTRLPEKPLADIAGIPMVVRVAQRVMQADAADAAARVVVAADHARIVQVCQDFGIEAILTDSRHASGSDRLAQACALLQLPDDAIVVNVQGDEPLIDPTLPAAVARQLASTPAASMATAAHPLHTLEEFANPNVVKVVCNAQQLALYFSRAAIPCWRGYPEYKRPSPCPPSSVSCPALHFPGPRSGGRNTALCRILPLLLLPPVPASIL